MSPRAPQSFASRYFHPGSWPFWGIHLVAIGGVIATGFSWSGVLLAAILYYTRMFFVAAAYHRYFAHRTFKTSRVMQFVFAVLANTTAQKGVLWWSAHHRRHHKYSDQTGDVHSAKLDGFWHSHVGWIVERQPERERVDQNRVRDLMAYPELRLLEHVNLLPAVVLAVVMAAIGGWFALLWGFFVPTVLLWHGTFTVNSLNHVLGRRRYETTDESRNNWFLALFVTLGEGWHNNHHHYMGSVNQGWRWYEIDVTYYLLRLMSLFGLVWDLKTPPPHVVRGERKRTPLPGAAAASAAATTLASAAAPSPTAALQAPQK